MAVSIQVVGILRVQQELNVLKDGITDNRPRLVAARDAYYRHVESVFDTEGASAGLYWPNLSPRRIAERGGLDHPILEWISGDLKRAATSPGINSGDEVLAGSHVSPTSLSLYMMGEKVIHEDGGMNADGFYVPQREFWPWYDQQFDIVVKPFDDFMDDWFGRP